jgi:3-phenylpropionate/trans-cinnamate dioxygenase ferredoxin subunit
MAWIEINDAGTLQNDEVMPLTLGERQLAVFRSDGEYFVTDNVCTHQYALLSDGYLEDGCIECPLHQARFDIRTGKAMCAPAANDIRTYPVKFEDSRVWVEL